MTCNLKSFWQQKFQVLNKFPQELQLNQEYSICWRTETKWADLMFWMSFICNYQRQESRKHTDKNTRQTEHLLNLFLESICTWGTVLSELLRVPGGPAKNVSKGRWTIRWAACLATCRGSTLRSLKPRYQSSPINTHFTKCECFCFHLASWAKIQRTFLLAFFPLVTKPHVFLS